MHYIKISEKLRLGYELEKRKDNLAIVADYVTKDKELANNIYFRYKILGCNIENIDTDFKSLVTTIKNDIDISDIIKNSTFGIDILRLVKKQICSTKWENIVGKKDLLTVYKELVKSGNQELEKEINKISKDEIKNYERLSEELLETNSISKINSMLKNKLIIKHRIFYGTAKQNIIYITMNFENEKDKKVKKARLEEKFEHMNTILNGGIYKLNIVLEENSDTNIWEVKDEKVIKEFVASSYELEEKLVLELEKLVGTQDIKSLTDKIVIS